MYILSCLPFIATHWYYPRHAIQVLSIPCSISLGQFHTYTTVLDYYNTNLTIDRTVVIGPCKHYVVTATGQIKKAKDRHVRWKKPHSNTDCQCTEAIITWNHQFVIIAGAKQAMVGLPVYAGLAHNRSDVTYTVYTYLCTVFSSVPKVWTQRPFSLYTRYCTCFHLFQQILLNLLCCS